MAFLASRPELVEKISCMVVSKKITVRELERAVPLIKSGTDPERAIELARNEVRLKVELEDRADADDPVEILLRRTRKLLESTLTYVDSASPEIEGERELYDIWMNEVRMKIHDAVDGVIFSEKVRRGRPVSSHRRPDEELFIWAG
jgi:hypothetical protein